VVSQRLSLSAEQPGAEAGGARRRMRDAVPLLAIILVGALLSWWSYRHAASSDETQVQGVLELRAEWRARDLERKIQIAAGPVQNVAIYMTTQDGADAEHFHRLVDRNHAADDPIRALVWAPRITAAERAGFEAGRPGDGVAPLPILEIDPAGRLVAAGDRQEYFPAALSIGFEGQQVLNGLDVTFDARRRTSALRATDEGRPIATAPSELLANASVRIFQIFWPVYRSGTIPPSPEERRVGLRGFAVGAYRFEAVLAAAIRGTPKIEEALYFFMNEGPGEAGAVPLASFDPVAEEVRGGVAASAVAALPGVHVTRDFEMLGRHWTIVSVFSPEIVAGLRSSGPWAWPISGMLLTAVAAVYFQREQRRMHQVEALVAERTAALARTRTFLDLVIENIPAMLFVKDAAEHRFVLINRAGEELLGYDRSELLGKNAYDLFPKEQAEAFVARDREVLESGRLSVTTEQPISTRHRGVRLLHTKKMPVLDEAGRTRYLLGFSEDITERKATEQQLVQAQKMEAIGNLTGGLAHDFNNLLGIVIGNLDLLRSLRLDSPDIEELSGEALEAAVRGADLTRRLLAFARRQPLRPLRIDVNEQIAGIMKLLGRTLGENISITLELDPRVGPVIADPVQFEASLTNLATNARDAMPRGGRLIVATRNWQLDEEYAARHHDVTPGDYALIEVSDTGMGMPPEVTSRIFEPFFSTKERDKGTGLGLSMVFGFIKQSGGHINVYSEIGVGTTFRLYLPLATEHGASALPQDAAPAPARGGGETVLAVEDNVALRRVVVRQLGELGYRVLEAENAAQALALLETEVCDLLFTDVIMPGDTDGFELARTVRARWPAIKVVLTSGFPATKLDGAERTGEHTRLLSKPYRKDDLARTLRSVLDG
jgi:PAS domain S-box-containing protein